MSKKSSKNASSEFHFDRSTLTNDVEALKDIICDYARQIHILTNRVLHLEERCMTLINLYYGQSSEKLSSQKSNPLSDPVLSDQSTIRDSKIDADLKKKLQK